MDSLHLSDSQVGADIPRKRSRRVQNESINVWILRILVGMGIIALGYYLSWWFIDGYIFQAPWLFIFLVVALFYAGTQIFGNWVLYLAARSPQPPEPPPTDLTVDVYVTAYREPYAMIERSLTAACAMRGAHRTWLLDDGSDPALAALAERLGAGYLTRTDHKDAKAGNLNTALPHTDGEIIAIFDIDHVALPTFLEDSLGYFKDPQMGFVQVMVTFDNARESWVAQAAMETSLEFYNPTSIGTAEVGGATMMGSNALIRRDALESIGGYQPGLAEDLATSIALHAAGWHSAYVAEPLAPGQAPPSLTAWFTQQLKWARGVFELLLTAYPRLFSKLTWGQRLSYAVRMTKYWIGPVVGLHLFATIGVLIFASAPVRDAFHDYLIHIMPLVMCDIFIRYVALQTWQHPSTPKTTFTNAVALVYATWPIYLWAWLMAVFRLPLSFKSTPKSKGQLSPVWLLPQIIALGLLVAGTLYTIFISGHKPSILLIFAIIQGGLQLILLAQWLLSEVQFNVGVPRYLAAMKNHSQSTRLVRREVGGFIRTYITDLPFTLDPIPLDMVEKSINLLNRARMMNKQVFIMGENSGQLLASLFACDLAKDNRQDAWTIFHLDWVPEEGLPAVKTGDHLPYHQLFIRQFISHVRADDVLVVLSPDGNRPKTLHALQLAKKVGAHSLAITGIERGHLGLQAGINLHIPCETEEQFNDGVLILEHIILRALREITGTAQQGRGEADRDDRGWLASANVMGSDAAMDMNLSTRAKKVYGTLYALSQETKQAVNRDHLLRRVLEVSIQVLGADSGSMVLFDKQGIACEAVMAYEGQVNIYPVEHVGDILQRGLAGWVVQHRQPVLIGNTRNDSRWLRRAWEDKSNSRSAISAPLVDGEYVFGVLTLVHSEADQFREDDLVLLGAIAVNASMLGGNTLRVNQSGEVL